MELGGSLEGVALQRKREIHDTQPDNHPLLPIAAAKRLRLLHDDPPPAVIERTADTVTGVLHRPSIPLRFIEATLADSLPPRCRRHRRQYVIAKDVDTQRATFKLLTSDGLMQYLKPLNPAYPTMPINNGHVRIIATVTEWRIGGKL